MGPASIDSRMFEPVASMLFCGAGGTGGANAAQLRAVSLGQALRGLARLCRRLALEFASQRHFARIGWSHAADLHVLIGLQRTQHVLHRLHAGEAGTQLARHARAHEHLPALFIARRRTNAQVVRTHAAVHRFVLLEQPQHAGDVVLHAAPRGIGIHVGLFDVQLQAEPVRHHHAARLALHQQVRLRGNGVGLRPRRRGHRGQQ
ncbi:hypothetical protein G6F50_014615 [Rhizopus delemar]|uniref:Uncharacterized protein n=1 Tax=Rhizopus delemar TaxID=936053 RepID=A0A9P6Y3W9_9FUNG|nr:hypothetical protein G6F50_014615 [Rhizopus delemar]